MHKGNGENYQKKWLYYKIVGLQVTYTLPPLTEFHSKGLPAVYLGSSLEVVLIIPQVKIVSSL